MATYFTERIDRTERIITMSNFLPGFPHEGPFEARFLA
jgi:hypothetical protein